MLTIFGTEVIQKCTKVDLVAAQKWCWDHSGTEMDMYRSGLPHGPERDRHRTWPNPWQLAEGVNNWFLSTNLPLSQSSSYKTVSVAIFWLHLVTLMLSWLVSVSYLAFLTFVQSKNLTYINVVVFSLVKHLLHYICVILYSPFRIWSSWFLNAVMLYTDTCFMSFLLGFIRYLFQELQF